MCLNKNFPRNAELLYLMNDKDKCWAQLTEARTVYVHLTFYCSIARGEANKLSYLVLCKKQDQQREDYTFQDAFNINSFNKNINVSNPAHMYTDDIKTQRNINDADVAKLHYTSCRCQIAEAHRMTDDLAAAVS